MKIIYENGKVLVDTGLNQYFLTEIRQIYLVQKRLEHYRNESTDEETLRMFTGAIDMLAVAKEEFIHYQELQCIKKLSSIH